MRTFAAFLGVLVLFFAFPLTGEEVESSAAPAIFCSPVGTWIGGSDPATPYMMTITSGSGGRYPAVFQLAIPAVFEPYLGITTWSGELVRVAPGKYEMWAVLFATWDPVWAVENGIDPTFPELHSVHGFIEFTNCNSVTNTIDLYDGFVNFDYTKGMLPFVTAPDWSLLRDGATLDEVYYRMPTTENRGAAVSPHQSKTSKPAGQGKLLRR